MDKIGDHSIEDLRIQLRYDTDRIARRWLATYEDRAEEEAKKIIPECYEKELFITAISKIRVARDLRRWNRWGV